MIDDNTKLIFVENPKSASSAVKQALTGKQFHDYGVLAGTMNHHPPKKIKNCYPKKWEDYRSFVVVRNTWDRALSFFNYYAGLMKTESYRQYDFDSWVAAGFPRPEEDHLQFALPDKNIGVHFLCQIHFTDDVDHVIKLHSIEPKSRSIELLTELHELSERWNFPIFPMKHNVNATRSIASSPNWSKKTVKLIEETFADEIEMFGFSPPV